MSEIKFEVKQSKRAVLLSCISISIFEIFFAGILIFICMSFISDKLNNFNNSAFIFLVCFLSIFIIIFIVLFIYILLNYFTLLDVYTNNKMFRMKGDKIIFEIDYKDIISFRQGIESICLFCKAPIIKKNGKKGPKTFYEHYAIEDINKIKNIIFSK